MDEIKIMLVEDHVLVREGTRELLEREDNLQVVAEAGDGEEAVRLAMAHRPDVIVMDIALPRLSGIDATKRIKAANPSTAVLVLTAYDDEQYVFALLEAGAAGYLLKDVSTNDLIEAIRAVHAGESALHPAIARKVVDHFAQRTQNDEEDSPVDLTQREMQVLKLAATGRTNREIGRGLAISTRTVQVHLSNIFGKLQVGSRTEAVLHALRKGWFTLEDTLQDGPGSQLDGDA
jgi:NarL family two-component system response regulator LiaR